MPGSLTHLTDAQISRGTGAESFRRGRDYAARGMVLEVEPTPSGGLRSKVRGSGARRYITVVSATANGFAGFCSCPMSRNCKHVAATLLAARDNAVGPASGQISLGPPAAAWETVLDQALGPVTAPQSVRPLALEFRMKHSSHGGPATVTLRPLARSTRGAQGGWVRTGAAWRDLRFRHPSPVGEPFDERQVESLRRIAHAADLTSDHYPDLEVVQVGRLGADWHALLSHAVESGVTLLDSRKGAGTPALEPEAAHLLATVQPPDDEQDAHFSVDLVVPGERPDAEWSEIADPRYAMVGLVGVTPHSMTLVRMDRPLGRDQRNLLGLKDLRIPAQDWARFATTRLPALRRLMEVEAPGGADLPRLAPRLHLTLRHAAEHTAQVEQGLQYSDPANPAHGGIEVPLPPDGSPVRDPAAEAALLGRVSPQLTHPALWHGDSLAATTVVRGMELVDLLALTGRLAGTDDVVVTQEGTAADYVEATDAPTITVGTSDRADGTQDWFDLSVEVTVGENAEHVPLGLLIGALAREEPALLLDSGTWFSLDRPELHRLASALAEARMLRDRESDSLRLSPLHVGLWEELVALGVVGHQSDAWVQRIQALTDLAARETIETPRDLTATLRPYQLQGFQWLSSLWQAGLGGVLADDMGLGKTLQVLAAIERAHESGTLDQPVLIVCPTSVMGTWQREAQRFCPGLRVAVLDQTRRKAGVEMTTARGDTQVVVTSYTLLRIDEEAFAAHPWSALVLDEAQFVKNHTAKGYKAARRVDAAATFVLTGTPLENSLMDLWSMLSLAAPGLYPSPERFKEHYVTPIERDGSAAMLAALRRRIRPLMLRRTKESVATELPPKQETVQSVPLAAKHRTIYDRHLQRERQRILGLVEDLNGNRIAILRALTMLRQLSLDPGLVDPDYVGVANPAKIDLLVEHLQELAAEGHRALVFSSFTGFLRLVRERLKAEGIEYCYLDGRTRKRADVVAAFKDNEAPAFLISLKAGGFGLTLTEADYVYVLDPWWNPAAETQAVDRAHRIGQEKPVNVYRLVSAGTIEEKVVALQQRKRELFDQVIDDGALLSSGALTADDIKGLLA